MIKAAVRLNRRTGENDMEATFKNAEDLLYSLPIAQQRIENYTRKLEKAIRRSGPSDISPIDFSQPVVHKTSQGSDIESLATEIGRLQNIIQEIKDTIGDIVTTVSQLQPDDQRIIELWYFKRMTKSEIATTLNYSSPVSVYSRRDKAVTRFMCIYPW